ncbi:hypothetical protein [Microbacterium enclense]|uniref:Uncharacterized protein n=1 Tax=Microbacterium enclense TaxID=993073 RepID=A0A1G6HMF0_9MICO|nr:hypothetical protein [Microbacterium enclense]SDB95477.1 hypothetical protein SAMN05216418_1348 [Microbacterium enclense]
MNTEPATPGQIRLGRGMEKRLEVALSPWDFMTRSQATDRIKMLKALSSCVWDADKTVLKEWNPGQWSWVYDPNREVDISGLLS